MRDFLRPGILCVALVGTLAVACTSKEPGNGTAGSTPTVGVTTSAAGTKSATPRPKAIKLDGIDPCTVFTPAQTSQLKTVRTTRDDSDLLKNGSQAPLCNYGTTGAPWHSYGVGLVTSAGIDYWDESGNIDVKAVEVSGYRAATLGLSGVDAFCAVVVDVADGQQLYVDYHVDDQSQDVMCQNAAKGAELALATLRTLK
ncbi:hypothetical protein GCM10022243_51970 [Saccharothrix violaceirubra]|uniref:DUF3558 domain-containing protein n=1 Tax=Saccharothrix violaceirubra TaxID=413306 RepID=A0A7W7TAF1_9PSEU|nr:DUF3558 domain-containing protein [Saccharothrix violaceirubra]MBB4969502.1 hypothetical protein [Saccharothrix violaceirubra]